jgi:hypothetical protein
MANAESLAAVAEALGRTKGLLEAHQIAVSVYQRTRSSAALDIAVAIAEAMRMDPPLPKPLETAA